MFRNVFQKEFFRIRLNWMELFWSFHLFDEVEAGRNTKKTKLLYMVLKLKNRFRLSFFSINSICMHYSSGLSSRFFLPTYICVFW